MFTKNKPLWWPISNTHADLLLLIVICISIRHSLRGGDRLCLMGKISESWADCVAQVKAGNRIHTQTNRVKQEELSKKLTPFSIVNKTETKRKKKNLYLLSEHRFRTEHIVLHMHSVGPVNMDLGTGLCSITIESDIFPCNWPHFIYE